MQIIFKKVKCISSSFSSTHFHFFLRTLLLLLVGAVKKVKVSMQIFSTCSKPTNAPSARTQGDPEEVKLPAEPQVNPDNGGLDQNHGQHQQRRSDSVQPGRGFRFGLDGEMFNVLLAPHLDMESFS